MREKQTQLISAGVRDADREFINSASDHNGASERIQCRVVPMLHNAIRAIVESGRFPYRTQGDVFRHAIYRHVRFLEEFAGSPTSVTKAVDVILELVRQDLMASDFEKIFTTLGARVQALTGEGRMDQARQLLALTKSALNEMPPGPWKTDYLSRFRKQFGAYLTAGRE